METMLYNMSLRKEDQSKSQELSVSLEAKWFLCHSINLPGKPLNLYSTHYNYHKCT